VREGERLQVWCVVRGLLLLLLYSLRVVPGEGMHGNVAHRLQKDNIKSPAKVHLDGGLARFV
jgi:hypothetical protein